MLKNMELVFSQADATALLFHQRIENERTAREAAAKEIVAGLGGSNTENEAAGQSIESILASIVDGANSQ